MLKQVEVFLYCVLVVTIENCKYRLLKITSSEGFVESSYNGDWNILFTIRVEDIDDMTSWDLIHEIAEYYR